MLGKKPDYLASKFISTQTVRARLHGQIVAPESMQLSTNGKILNLTALVSIPVLTR